MAHGHASASTRQQTIARHDALDGAGSRDYMGEMSRHTILQSLLFLIFFEGLSGTKASAAADEYLHDFERRSDLEAWLPYDAALGCNLVNPGVGGNPGGHMQVDCTGEFVGVWTRSPDFTGNLATSRWVLGFDLANVGTRKAQTIDIILYGGGTAWMYYGSMVDTPLYTWTSYGLTVDPTWTDDEARANHWVAVALDGGAITSWASVWKDVEALGLRTSLEPLADVTGVKIGIDNVVLRPVP